jgi:hypothetical protein
LDYVAGGIVDTCSKFRFDERKVRDVLYAFHDWSIEQIESGKPWSADYWWDTFKAERIEQ